MPRRSGRAKLTYALNHGSHSSTIDNANDDELTFLEPPDFISTQFPAKKKKLKDQLTEKDATITHLESIILRLRLDLRDLQKNHEYLFNEHNSLITRNQLLYATNTSLASRKRKAESALSDE